MCVTYGVIREALTNVYLQKMQILLGGWKKHLRICSCVVSVPAVTTYAGAWNIENEITPNLYKDANVRGGPRVPIIISTAQESLTWSR